MGSVAILNPQDCLKETFFPKTLISPSHVKKPRIPNSNNTTRANRTQPNRRKKSPSRVNTNAPSKKLVMGQVKILKRGEDLSKTASDKENRQVPDLSLTEPVSLPSLFYAGSSAVIASPPPSSLPLPAFFTKKCVSVKTEDVESDLRRILRLDL